jgi:DNA-binding transcriptional regulator Cro
MKLTDSQIIDLLGGTTAVAKMCKVSPPAVAQWKNKGIPYDKMVFLGAELEKKSYGLMTRKNMFPKVYKFVWPELD